MPRKPLHLSGPQCPACKDIPLVPEREMSRAGEYGEGVNACCPACGDGVVLSDADMAMVERCSRAWERSNKAGDTLAAKRRAGWRPRARGKRPKQLALGVEERTGKDEST